LKNKQIVITNVFEKYFSRLPKEIREAAYEKLELFTANPHHPSLRVKRIKGTASIWEMSITMNYRLTFEVSEQEIFLRKIGTHDILNRP
jgi:mRNA-degrading endonuclease RelE of RelBE toxin-antitoxin system